MGNKRSGSTLMVNLLNLHPRVFVTHESDIVWILHQASRGLLHEARCHPLDGPRGMESTLEICRDIAEAAVGHDPSVEQVTRAFLQVQEHIMRHGSAMDKPAHKNDLAWIGDKKPVQHSDPQLRPFLRTHFPEARYVHLVRNPRHVVASMAKAAKTWKVVPEYWKGTPEDLLERWAIQEEWVLAAKSEPGAMIHTLRMEDLCQRPVDEMAAVFTFLDLEMPDGAPKRIARFIDPDPGRKHQSFTLPTSPRASQIMELYGY